MTAPEPIEATAPLRAEPASAAVLCDIDGTLAPIVIDPGSAEVPAPARRCSPSSRTATGWSPASAAAARAPPAAWSASSSSSTPATTGSSCCGPGEAEPRLDPALGHRGGAAAAFVARLDWPNLGRIGLRLEDKGPIQAIHWRGARDPELAEQRARTIAELAAEQGLVPHFGRLVLELRPVATVDKGVAVRRLVGECEARAALYGGDDRTDLDAFVALRELSGEGTLADSVCVGVASSEGPAEIRSEADLVVAGPGRLRRPPAGPLMLFCDLLRVSSLLVAGVATALGAVTVLVANQDADELVLAVAGGWWVLGAGAGIWLGRPARAAESIARLLAGARTATHLPSETPGRIAFMRLWPIGAFALLVGVRGLVLAAGGGDRRRLRDPDRARLARARARRRGDRGARRRPLLRRAVLGLRARSPGAHARPLSRPRADAPSHRRPRRSRPAKGAAAPRSRTARRALNSRIAPAGEGDRAAAGRGERRDTGEHEAGPGAGDLREPADDRAADRGRAEEDDRVERHHPAAHRRARRRAAGSS